MTVLAIDQGTSGTKAIVVDDAGAVVWRSPRNRVRPSYLRRRRGRAGPRRTVRLGGRRRAPRARRGRRARGRGRAGQPGRDRAGVGPGDRPSRSTPAIVWQDRRAEASVPRQARARRTRGVASGPAWCSTRYFSAPKMRVAAAATSPRDGVVTTTDTWLVHRLCGAFVTDASTASRSLLHRPGRRRVGPRAARPVRPGRRGSCPHRRAATQVVGETDVFGPTAMPVAGLIVDQQAALLAQRCLEPGTAKCTFGTGAFLLAQHRSATPCGPRRG